jgi:NAD(P)-dependent dehydrogenase (short-subunit alcohol dehydrogenase family)
MDKIIRDVSKRAAALLSLEGKVGMVTGAGSGIGRGIAMRLAEMGGHIAVLDKDLHRATETTEALLRIGGNAIAVQCDVRSRADCQRATEQTVSVFKRVDILCNNAGIAIRKDSLALSEQEWDEVLDVTLKAVYLLSREVIPHMVRQGGGVIINTGSGWSLKGGPKAISYCAAKGGVLNLTRAMAIDHGKDNIRVNCVCPGDVDTPMLASECRQLGEDAAEFMKAAADRPLARVGTPEDVANAVLFFASDLSRWVTGAHLVVDGGGLA